ncbi:MmpS family transport accessory protein [Micromonospora sp. DPT]|uniref:MmpS family transport accessory protein n=1 Tax=Micromonospora sp. DPT TaxID=3142975 RepID=UPI0032095718
MSDPSSPEPSPPAPQAPEPSPAAPVEPSTLTGGTRSAPADPTAPPAPSPSTWTPPDPLAAPQPWTAPGPWAAPSTTPATPPALPADPATSQGASAPDGSAARGAGDRSTAPPAAPRPATPPAGPPAAPAGPFAAPGGALGGAPGGPVGPGTPPPGWPPAGYPSPYPPSGYPPPYAYPGYRPAPDPAQGRRVVGIVIAVVAVLVLGVCGCVGVGSALVGRYTPTADEPYYDDPDPYYDDDYDEESAAPTWTPPTPSEPATAAATPSTGRGRFVVSYEVTGEGRGDVQYYDANGEFIRLEGVRLPWRQQIRTDDPERVLVMAWNNADEGRVTCSARVGDRRPVTHAGEPGYQVSCGAH